MVLHCLPSGARDAGAVGAQWGTGRGVWLALPPVCKATRPQAAQELCDLYKLPQDECNDLWCVVRDALHRAFAEAAYTGTARFSWRSYFPLPPLFPSCTCAIFHRASNKFGRGVFPVAPANVEMSAKRQLPRTCWGISTFFWNLLVVVHFQQYPMKALSLLIIGCALLSPARAQVWPDPDAIVSDTSLDADDAFNMYLEAFGKAYEDPDVYDAHKKAFLESLQFIRDHNAAASPFKVGLTPMADVFDLDTVEDDVTDDDVEESTVASTYVWRMEYMANYARPCAQGHPQAPFVQFKPQGHDPQKADQQAAQRYDHEQHRGLASPGAPRAAATPQRLSMRRMLVIRRNRRCQHRLCTGHRQDPAALAATDRFVRRRVQGMRGWRRAASHGVHVCQRWCCK